MNLLKDSWIETDVGQKSVVDALNQAQSPSWGRGDWDAATLQFLIGLMQTIVVYHEDFCPKESHWRNMLSGAPHDLSEFLAPLVDYFDGPVFEDKSELTSGTLVPISYLLPESPKGNTIKLCKDIGQWVENAEQSLTESEARIALYSDAIWGMGIGRGFLQGPLGGSKMWVFVEPDTPSANLWSRVWLNVLSRERWLANYGNIPLDLSTLFPWFTGIEDRVVTPKVLHPLSIYWTIPRRNRLQFEDGKVSLYRRMPGGFDYKGWRHPLTPYVTTKEGNQIGVKVSPGHLAFDDWAGIAVNLDENAVPSVVVNEFLQSRQEEDYLRLKCVAWSSKTAEAYAWVEGVFPFIQSANTTLILDLLEEAENVRRGLSMALKNGLKGAANSALIGTIGRQSSNTLYQNSESSFFQSIRENENTDWFKQLRRIAIKIYDEIVDQFRCDPVEVAKARVKLQRWSKKI